MLDREVSKLRGDRAQRGSANLEIPIDIQQCGEESTVERVAGIPGCEVT